ncbi:MAG: hypothetical protein RL071_2092 [Pseudomonadota bacterium]
MSFWTDTAILDLLWLGLLLFIAQAAHQRVALLHRLALPPVLVAGGLGLLLGPGGLDLLQLHAPVLESIAYHGLGLVFVAMGLQPPPPGKASGDARSAGYAVTTFTVAQGVLGLLLVGIASLVGPHVHPGVGLMLPLGFAQGPGQALSLGRAWEEGAGMASGAQVGLAMATQGFLWCSLLGVALYHWGRRRGWMDDPTEGAAAVAEGEAPAPSADAEASADMDPLTRTLALIAVLYLSTWGVLQGLSAALAGAPKIAASIAGFHFLIGLGFAVGARTVLQRRGAAGGLHQPSLGRVAGVAVDVTAAAAIAAVRVDQIADQMVMIVVFGTICAALTAVGCVWLGSRAFRTQRFAHVLVLFGTMTGTLPTGLALARLADPGLSGPAPRSFVGGTTLAALMGLPLILFVLPFAVAGWPDAHFSRLGLTLLLLLAYLGLLMLGWRRFSQLSPLRGPLWAPLPGAADADAR